MKQLVTIKWVNKLLIIALGIGLFSCGSDDGTEEYGEDGFITNGINTGDVDRVYFDAVKIYRGINVGAGYLACSSDASLLSEENLKSISTANKGSWEEASKYNKAWQFWSEPDFQVLFVDDRVKFVKANAESSLVAIWGLETGTKYYYRGYNIISGRYVLGEIKSFTTKGYKKSDLLKYLSVTIENDDSEEEWRVKINTKLNNLIPNKEIKYGIRASLRISEDFCRKYRNKYDLIGVSYHKYDNEAYADNRSGMSACVKYPVYLGTYYMNDGDEDRHWIDPEIPEDSYAYYDMGDYLTDIKAIQVIREKEKIGISSEEELEYYHKLLNITIRKNEVTENIINTLEVFVEIEDVDDYGDKESWRYIISEKSLKAIMPWWISGKGL